MKRFGWLILLISLGVNLGLGYRILNPPADQENFGGRGRDGEFHRGRGRSEKGEEGPTREKGLRSSRRDSSSWRQLMEGRLNRVAKRLELTPEQLSVFQSTHQENAAGFLAQRRMVNQAQDQLHSLIIEGTVDPDSVRLAIRAVGRQQAVLDSLITESILGEMEVLNPEQRSQYLQILPIFKNQTQGRRSSRGGRFNGH